ncbi:MAG: hypothetical protein U9R68_03495 [Planctomycetota bacterium]|nr:hypothetical protein [Planctomycetota bacterium]
MSTDASTQTDQTPPDGSGQPPEVPGTRQPPHAIIQESIKYRRRAQEAERRVEALETEVNDLRDGRDQQAAGLQAQLDQARAEAETLHGRLADLERDRNLEHALAQAGVADAETALALARERLAGQDAPEDLAAFAKGLLDEKPHLRGVPARSADSPAALPPKTAGAKPASDDAPRRAAQRLADHARQSGRHGDVLAYMRARRGVTA